MIWCRIKKGKRVVGRWRQWVNQFWKLEEFRVEIWTLNVSFELYICLITISSSWKPLQYVNSWISLLNSPSPYLFNILQYFLPILKKKISLCACDIYRIENNPIHVHPLFDNNMKKKIWIIPAQWLQNINNIEMVARWEEERKLKRGWYAQRDIPLHFSYSTSLYASIFCSANSQRWRGKRRKKKLQNQFQ